MINPLNLSRANVKLRKLKFLKWPLLSTISTIAVALLLVTSVRGIEYTEETGCPLTPKLTLVEPSPHSNPKGFATIKTKYYKDSKGQDATQIFVPGKLNLTLECRASQPIDFGFEGQYMSEELWSVETSRKPTSSSRKTCYSIVIKLGTDKEATGLYKCWTISKKNTSPETSLYLFANGGSPPYLLHDEDTIIMGSVQTSQEVGVLPCLLTNPEIPVALYRVTRHGFDLLSLGPHLSYDPKLGFLINLQKFPEPYGKFKCVAKSDQGIQDQLIVQLDDIEKVRKSTAKIHKPEIFLNDFTKPLIQQRDRFSDRQDFICTAPESAELVIQSTPNCRTPIECRFKEKCFHSQDSKCSKFGRSCSKHLRKEIFSSNNFLRESSSCESLGRNGNGGIVQCTASKYVEGDSLTYFVGLGGNIVRDWRSAPTKEYLRLSTPLGHQVTYNVGENINFSCIGSRFIFSSGFGWKVELKNGTLISANASTLGTRIKDNSIEEEVVVKISMPEILKVVCLAPIWNLSEWANSSLSLKVQDTVAPTFLQPENVTIYFYPNEKNRTLECEAEGFPQPDILWLKKGEEFQSDLKKFDYARDNVTLATLVFPEIAESDHGVVFTCNASNPRGMVFKTYTIHVRAHLFTIIFSVVGTGLFICFAVVLYSSYVVFKRLKKKVPIGYTFHFSDLDVDEFKTGNPDAVQRCTDVSEQAFYLPYDEELYELKDEHLTIDNENVLGQGEFGMVIKGRITRDNESFPVAVKSLKGQDIQKLKALLSELKIMIYIGYHRNIVKLIGAITTTLAEKQAMVVVEYCALGNLEGHLRKHRATFLDEFEPESMLMDSNNMTPSYVRVQYLLKTTDLLKWSYEMATGLEYLAYKKIIHGDIALRNMLLDSNQTIKITDFGLSKQLYKYTSNYVTKKKDVPLPWKWLAPECLRDNTFSSQSDTWAYGITLWELFSLAEIPYQGLLFNFEFLRQLANGYRLDKPAYCNMEIYSIMRECWRQDAEERPNFTMLRSEFAQRLPPGLVDELGGEEDEILAQNETNHLQEVFLPNYIQEIIPLTV